MPIQFQCPSCNRRLQVGSKKASQRVECPECAADVVVPTLAEAAAVSAMVASVDVEMPENGFPDFSSIAQLDLDRGSSTSTTQSEPTVRDAKQALGVSGDRDRAPMSRGAIYALVLLLLVALLIGFAAGLFVGRSQEPGVRRSGARGQEYGTGFLPVWRLGLKI